MKLDKHCDSKKCIIKEFLFNKIEFKKLFEKGFLFAEIGLLHNTSFQWIGSLFSQSSLNILKQLNQRTVKVALFEFHLNNIEHWSIWNHIHPSTQSFFEGLKSMLFIDNNCAVRFVSNDQHHLLYMNTNTELEYFLFYYLDILWIFEICCKSCFS